MRPQCVIIASILTIAFAGCAGHRSARVTPLPPTVSSEPVPVLTPHSHTLVQETLTLTLTRPTTQRGDYHVGLVSIADDGTTRIQVVETGKELTAQPGGFFASQEFGSKGLQLLSASKASGAVSMVSRGCISQ
jgi:hypothetical protein